jgi:predicted 2-oxoglutarate/Fe(II)-dependent dioxygenase YbiX
MKRGGSLTSAAATNRAVNNIAASASNVFFLAFTVALAKKTSGPGRNTYRMKERWPPTPDYIAADPGKRYCSSICGENSPSYSL